MNTLIEKAVNICGSQVLLAESIGAKQQYVSAWLNSQRIVAPRFVLPIEKATNGQVTRHELRPDIYPIEE